MTPPDGAVDFIQPHAFYGKRNSAGWLGGGKVAVTVHRKALHQVIRVHHVLLKGRESIYDPSRWCHGQFYSLTPSSSERQCTIGRRRKSKRDHTQTGVITKFPVV